MQSEGDGSYPVTYCDTMTQTQTMMIGLQHAKCSQMRRSIKNKGEKVLKWFGGAVVVHGGGWGE